MIAVVIIPLFVGISAASALFTLPCPPCGSTGTGNTGGYGAVAPAPKYDSVRLYGMSPGKTENKGYTSQISHSYIQHTITGQDGSGNGNQGLPFIGGGYDNNGFSGQLGLDGTGASFGLPNPNFGQVSTGNFAPGLSGNYGQAQTGNYGQGTNGNFGQAPSGNYGQGVSGNGQGAYGNYGQIMSRNNNYGATGNYAQSGSGPIQGVPGNYGQNNQGSSGQYVSGSKPGPKPILGLGNLLNILKQPISFGKTISITGGFTEESPDTNQQPVIST